MTQKFLCYIILISLSTSLFCQSQSLIGTTQQQNGTQGFFGTLMNRKELNTIIEGSQYINEDWKPGRLYLSNDIEIEVALLNYNVFEEELTYMEGNREYLISTYSDLKKFTISDETFLYLYTDYSKDIYKLLSDGPVRLLKRYYCKILMGMESKGIIGATNDKYTMNDDLFVQEEGLQPEPFKSKKRELYKLMDDKREQIDEYIDEMNLNVNKEPDLIQLFDYYNQLTSIQ